MYQIDDYVMHRSNGLCRVIGTGYPEFGGEKGENLTFELGNVSRQFLIRRKNKKTHFFLQMKHNNAIIM